MRGGTKAALGVAGTLVFLLVLVGAFVAGTYSKQPDIDAANRRADRVAADLKSTQKELADTKVDLDSTQSELADANATLASCDADKASQVFDDVMGQFGSLLQQYNRYLNDSSTYFFINWNALDKFDHGYSGNNSMQDQFDAALASCTSGSGSNA